MELGDMFANTRCFFFVAADAVAVVISVFC